MSGANVAGSRPLSQFLRMAVIAGVESAVQIHIDRGDDLNARDGNGMTPLMLSAARNKPAICKLLLDAGVDHGLLDPSGQTAHAIAIASGAREAAAVLGAISARASFPSEPAPHPSPIGNGPGPATEPETEARVAPTPLADTSAGDLGTMERQGAKPNTRTIEIDEASDFDLSGWEAEEEAAPPPRGRSFRFGLCERGAECDHIARAHRLLDGVGRHRRLPARTIAATGSRLLGIVGLL